MKFRVTIDIDVPDDYDPNGLLPALLRDLEVSLWAEDADEPAYIPWEITLVTDPESPCDPLFES